MKIGLAVRPGRVPEKKGQDRTVKQKSYKVVTFRLFGEKPPLHRLKPKFAYVITYATFQDDIFKGYDFTGGRISHFRIDICMSLTTVQLDSDSVLDRRKFF